MNDKKNHWFETRWQLLDQNVEDFQARLEQIGSLGSYVNLPLDANEATEQAELLAYFPDNSSIDLLKKQVQMLETPETKLTDIERIPQGNWATEWKKYFKPFFLTKDIVIRPSWEEYQKEGNEKVITLDPGMAFGTGQHDTTKFCVEFISELIEKNPNLHSLIDVGCGSGILSIIAKRAGFENVVGFDVEEPAIETAKENLERNPEAKDIFFYANKGPIVHKNLTPAKVVVANIIAETLCELHDELVSLLLPEGFLILSGIISERKDIIEKTFSDLKLITTKQSANWNAYLYYKK